MLTEARTGESPNLEVKRGLLQVGNLLSELDRV